MLKGLFKLLLLAGLSAGASSLPNLLGGKMGALPGGLAAVLPGATGLAGALPGAGGSDEGAAQLAGDLAQLPETINNLRNLDHAHDSALEGLSPAEQEMMREAMPKLEFKSNALTQSLGLAPGSKNGGQLAGKASAAGSIAGRLLKGTKPECQSFSDYRRTLLQFLERHQAGMATALWLVPAGAALLSFLLFLGKQYTLSLSLTGLIFLVANFVIWILSASVVLSAALTKQSLLPALPRDLWLSPVVFLVVSCGLLRLVDENYPFWNKTITTLFTPIAASCLAAGWGQAAGLGKAVLSFSSKFMKT